jgi:hypothetical protein
MAAPSKPISLFYTRRAEKLRVFKKRRVYKLPIVYMIRPKNGGKYVNFLNEVMPILGEPFGESPVQNWESPAAP